MVTSPVANAEQEHPTARYWVTSGSKVKNPEWTPELIEKVKADIAEGLSGGTIADKHGFATRNAIIGKMNRLGIRAKPKPRNDLRTKAIESKLSEKTHEGRNGQGVVQSVQARHRYREPLAEEAPQLTPTVSDLETPLHQRCTLLELTNTTCRWPIGDPASSNFFFCGGAADLSNKHAYCTVHTEQAQRKYLQWRERS